MLGFTVNHFCYKLPQVLHDLNMCSPLVPIPQLQLQYVTFMKDMFLQIY